jgi:hypothetical protein
MTADQLVREDMRLMFEDEQIELLPPRTTMSTGGGGGGGRRRGNVTQTAVAVAQINQFGLVNINTGDATAVAFNVNG